jgi:hypothetical protein
MERDAFFYMRKNQNIFVMVGIDEEMFQHLVNSYKKLWANKKLGQNVAVLNLVREILHAAEEGCREEVD